MFFVLGQSFEAFACSPLSYLCWCCVAWNRIFPRTHIFSIHLKPLIFSTFPVERQQEQAHGHWLKTRQGHASGRGWESANVRKLFSFLVFFMNYLLFKLSLVFSLTSCIFHLNLKAREVYSVSIEARAVDAFQLLHDKVGDE